MKRLVTVALLACTLSAGAAAPNVIIYLMDDLGLTDVQQHPTFFPDGSPLFETPNMHRLAAQGMRFNHAYAQPLCSASRATLLSGQKTAARDSLYLAIVGGSSPNPGLAASANESSAYVYPQNRDHLPLEVETIAERLKAAGYATWHAGKWHLSPSSSGSNPNPGTTYYPDQQGFDQQLGVGGPGPSRYFGPFGGIPNMVDHLGNPAVGAVGDHIGDHMAGLVQDMIDDHLTNSPETPFFLYYPAFSVHGPHQAKQSLFDYYQTKLSGLPDSKHQHPLFAAQVHSADDEIGLMLDYLDSKGLADNTLLIFLSDNGGLSITRESGTLFDDIGADGIADDDPANVVNGSYAATTAPIDASTRLTEMAPLRAGKGALYEGGIRVPMIVRYPDGGIAAGSQTDEPVQLVDLYQTILDYTPAAAKPGYTLDGVSLKPVLEQTGSLPERDIMIFFPRNSTTWGTKFINTGYPDADWPFSTYPGGTAVINHPFKMIARYSTAHDAETVDYQLFRLDTDVGESDNVAGKYPEVVDAMRQRMDVFHQDTGALVPIPNPSYNGSGYDSAEITFDDYLADAGLALLTPEAFKIADPDGDHRNNRQEFLEQTAPNTSDTGVATIWLSDGDLRFSLPANTDPSIYSIIDGTGAVAFTVSDLEMDGQYGPFFVYKPTNPIPSPDPADYSITVADAAPRPRDTADLTVDYRALLSDAQSSRTDTLPLSKHLLVDTVSGQAVVEEVTVTTTSVSGDFRPGGSHGLAVIGGLNDLWFDSEEKITLDFVIESTDGTLMTTLQVRILDVGARAPEGETMTLSNQSVQAIATWPTGSAVNGTPATLGGLV
jgi:arylsulfatase A-like enzyme